MQGAPLFPCVDLQVAALIKSMALREASMAPPCDPVCVSQEEDPALQFYRDDGELWSSHASLWLPGNTILRHRQSQCLLYDTVITGLPVMSTVCLKPLIGLHCPVVLHLTSSWSMSMKRFGPCFLCEQIWDILLHSLASP